MQTDELAEAAAWYNNLRASSNAAFMPLYADHHRYLVLMGGGGSGKSIFAGRKILERVTTEPGHRWLVVRKVANTIRESCFQQLRGQIADHYPQQRPKVNKTDQKITFPNGSEILTAGLDDVEKLKSIYNITGVWIEEASEITEQDFDQLDIRLRGDTRYYKQIILSFNPISINHWLKKRFFDRRDPRARVHKSTYHDNRFLPAEDIATLEAFRETDPYYYDVYCLGNWGVTGTTIFDAAALQRQLREVSGRKCKQGLFTYDYNGLAVERIQWEPDADGVCRIYAEPEPGVPYVIGADTAGEGSDSFVAQVLDNRTGKLCATLRGQFDEDIWARQLYCLGRYYDDALIGVETNFSTYTVLELERLGYPYQYVRESVDDYTHAVRRSFGFRTDPRTRPVIIAGLVQAVRGDAGWIPDETTLQEMTTFIRNPETLRPEAAEGQHDDTVMALAIALFIRPQQRTDIKPVAGKAKWTESMWEDYRRAKPDEREFLIRKWGYPNER